MPSPSKVTAISTAGGNIELLPNVGQTQLINTRFANVAAAEAATFADGDVCNVDVSATGKTTTYAYIANSSLTRDGISVLNTGAGGTTRLLAIGNHASDVLVNAAGAAAFTTAQEFLKISSSAGLASGGEIIYAGSQTYTVQAGAGLLRDSDSDYGPLFHVTWPAVTGRSIADGVREHVFVSWNSGSPILTFKTTFENNTHTEFHLGSVVREGTALHILMVPDKVANYCAKNSERQRHKGFEIVSGLVISSIGTRNIYCSAGEAYYKINELTFSVINTSTVDTFDAYVGTTKDSSGNTQWDNQNYNLAGTKTALGSSKWGVHWVYRCACGGLATVYGTSNASTFTEASLETSPQALPVRLSDQGFLLGRIIFQKSSSTGTFEPIQKTIFTPGTATNHADLTNLQGGAAGEYYHLTSSEATKLATVIVNEVSNASELSTLADDDRFPVVDVSETPDLIKRITKSNLAAALELTADKIVQIQTGTSTDTGDPPGQDLSPTYVDLDNSSVTMTARFSDSLLIYIVVVQVASLDPSEGCVVHFKVLADSTEVQKATARRGSASASGEGKEILCCYISNPGALTSVTVKTQVREYSGSLDSITGATYSMDGATSRYKSLTLAMLLEVRP